MWRWVVVSAAAVLMTAGCGQGHRSDGRAQVVTSFYPLQYVAERIGGVHVQVSNLTAPGVEPHDLELAPRQVADLSAADVVVYEKGLQPSVDQAIANDTPARSVDAAAVVSLRPGDGGVDPHFWQDPTLLAEVADVFTTTMVRADPAHAADYRAGDRRLQDDLTLLDRELRAGLRTCRTRSVVVSHDAFEYLARRYGLQVHAIAGLSPDAEPSAQRLSQLGALARATHVTTVFSERLASPKLADTLAGELGLTTAVLDPIEGLSSSDPHADYLSLMRANLAALRTAGGCT